MNPTTKVDEGHEKTVLLSPYQDNLLESAKRARRTIVDINQYRGPQKAPRADAILRDLRGQILFCRRKNYFYNKLKKNYIETNLFLLANRSYMKRLLKKLNLQTGMYILINNRYVSTQTDGRKTRNVKILVKF